MGILVVGSVALDDVQTPAGSRKRTLGGACTYFAMAASLYTRVSIVAVVGKAFPQEHIELLGSRNIDLRGLQVVNGETFYWSGRYAEELDSPETLDTQLNVFADFHPAIPQDLRNSEYVFLANIDPDLQIEVLKQVDSPRLTALDSMNFWITSKKGSLRRAMSQVDVLMLNETEVRLFAREANLLLAAHCILELGPKVLIVKRGEHGAMLVTRGESPEDGAFFFAPAYPLERVVDPTGAGDSFAAGFMGYLARSGDLSCESLRKAVVHGTVVASFTVEDFSIDRLRDLTLEEIEARYNEFRYMTYFEPMGDAESQIFQRSIIE